MKVHFLLFIFLFSVLQCKKDTKEATSNWQKISENVQYRKEADFFELQSNRFRYKIPKSKLPFKKVVLLNASLIGYFNELGLENTIAGVSSPEYIYSEKILNRLKNGIIKDIGNEQKYDLEKIIALKPDVIFSNYIASFENTYDIIKKNGIEIIFLDEYLEQDPLEKTKYLKVFGALFNKEKESEKRFSTIAENYNSLKKSASDSKRKPTVLANEMYGNQWFLPGGKTSLARFIADANGKYINAENGDSKAVPLSFEEVFAKSQNAEFWINVGNHQAKKELLLINPNYAKMNVYQNGKLYAVNALEKGKSNDYFERGVVRADLVLKDYIKIFHPELLSDYQLTFMKELK